MMRRVARQKIIIYCISFVIAVLIFRYMNNREVDWDSLVPKDDIERVHRKVTKHDKWIIVTSIQHPTYQVKQLALIPGWKLLVVGDRKSPKDWKLHGAIYLDTETQKELKYKIHRFLPYDSYTRKAIGYLYAIEHGAAFIYETDDDNEPYDNLKSFHTSYDSSTGVLIADAGKNLTFNPYPHFGQSSLWPRGYPLEAIGVNQPHIYQACSSRSIPAIQQGLVNGDPDVDAIFRLTRKHSSVNLDLKFDSATPPVVLPHGVFAPYNTQNTLISARAFWSLILPTTVKVRACDIYRSYWAQRLLWLIGSHVAFYPPTSFQRRNPHSSIKDATEEAELYQNMGRFLKFLSEWKCKEVFFFDCARKLTEDLVVLGFLGRQDLDLVDAWFTDLATIGYMPPPLRQRPEVCSSNTYNLLLFYAWEQKTTMFYTMQNIRLPILDWNQVNNTETVAEYCGKSAAFCMSNTGMLKYETGQDILLLLSVSNTQMIPMMDAAYRPLFPHILYCGKAITLQTLEQKHKISYVSVKGSANAASCLLKAVDLGYNVQGYLHISSSMFLQPELVSSLNKNQVWSMANPQVYKPHVIGQCNDQNFHCVSLTPQKLTDFQNHIEMLEDISQKQKIKKCFGKISLDENLKHNTGLKYLRDPVFYLPSRLVASFKNMVGLLGNDKIDSPYSFLVFLIMECMELVTEFLHSTDMQELHVDGTKNHIIMPFQFEDVVSKEDIRQVYCDYMSKLCV